MNSENIKSQILKHLHGGEAFQPLEKIIDGFNFHSIGFRMHGLPYSVYELFYHICYTQKDILNFCVSDNYSEPKWPDDYWPTTQASKSETEWEALKTTYIEDRNALSDLVKSPDALTEIVKNGSSQTLFREILLIIEHTAYHTGQLVVLSRLL